MTSKGTVAEPEAQPLAQTFFPGDHICMFNGHGHLILFDEEILDHEGGVKGGTWLTPASSWMHIGTEKYVITLACLGENKFFEVNPRTPSFDFNAGMPDIKIGSRIADSTVVIASWHDMTVSGASMYFTRANGERYPEAGTIIFNWNRLMLYRSGSTWRARHTKIFR